MSARTIDILCDRDRRIDFKSWDDIEGNPFFVGDASRVPELEAYVEKLPKSVSLTSPVLKKSADD